MSNISINNQTTLPPGNHLTEIFSKQPWLVLNAARHYDIVLPKNSAISHFYSFEADQSKGLTLAIPDGCVDIVFDCDQTSPTVKICGTTLEAKNANLIHKHRYFGARFGLGVLPEFLDTPVGELVNHEINLLELHPEAGRALEQIIRQPLLTRQVELFRNFHDEKKVRICSALTLKTMRFIRELKGDIRVKSLEALSGCSSRTLQRQFQNDMGISPKVFSRITRCQAAIYNISYRKNLALSELASDLGFSDQPHLQREFKKYVSATPAEYKHRVKNETYLNRIRCCNATITP